MTENRNHQRRGLRRIIVGLMAASFLVTAGMGVASAATGSGNGQAGFTAQAKKAGLTSAQANALQARVDAYLAKAGGKQVAANEIRYANGGSLLLALPGEKRARDLDAPVTTQQTCNYYYICTYSGQYYTGDVLTGYYCNQLTYIPWVGYGSWINNQTPGTVARFLNAGRGEIDRTPPAYSARASYYWTPVYYIDPC